jgi:outer membrane protein OmpA-like peptidoglycan-associated protein
VGHGKDPAVRHFGYSVRWVVYSVATATGLRAAAVRELVTLTTLLVLVGLREYMNVGALDAKALRERLADEHPAGVRSRLHTLVEACVQARSLAGRDANGAGGATRPPLRKAAVGALVLAVAIAAALVWRDAADPSGGPGIVGVSSTLGEPAPGSDVTAAGQGTARLNELKDFLSAGPPEGEFVFALDGVRFEPNSAMLDSSSNVQLRALAAVLAGHPKTRTTLAVRAEGDDEDAMELAKNRAVAVRAALAVFGVPLLRTHHEGVSEARSPGNRVEARVGRT